MKTEARPAFRLYSWLWSSLDWVYPPRCGGCGGRGARWCTSCQQVARRLTPPLCETCGIPISKGARCARCVASLPAYHRLRSWAAFAGPVRNALHRLKYHRDIGLGESLSRCLAELLASSGWQVDTVVPVPLSRQRQAERGYNQAAFLALPLALARGLRYSPGSLAKIRDTASQVKLSLEQRKVNTQGAFQADPRLVVGKRILLIDDVATSGATLDACAAALLEANALQVYCLTLARAV